MIKEVFWNIFEILATVFETFIILSFATKFLGAKSEETKRRICFVFSWLVFSAIVLIINQITVFENFAAIFLSGIVFLYCLLFLCGNIYKKIIVSIIPIAVIILVNSLVATFVALICREEFSNLLTEENLYRFFTIVITKFLLYYVLLVIEKIFEKQKRYSFGKAEWAPIILTFLISAAIFTSIDLINIENDLNIKGEILILFSTLCLVVLNVVSFYMVVKISQSSYIESENKLLKIQNEYQSHYVDNVKNQEKEIKTIRHDLKHNLFVIEAQLKSGKYEEAQNHITQILKQEVLIGGTVSTDNETVNAILNSKIIYAKSIGINVVVQACKTIIDVADIDLCNLLGNLLDNAIEACEKCVLTEKTIEILISVSSNVMTLSIKNTIESSVLKTNSKLVTSKKKQSEHGFGMASVKQIVNKYNGKLDIYEKDNMFCVTAILLAEV